MTIGIVLGGGITDEGTLPRDVQTRVLKAHELLQKKVIRKIILSGRERLSLLLSKNISISFLFSIRDYFIS